MNRTPTTLVTLDPTYEAMTHAKSQPAGKDIAAAPASFVGIRVGLLDNGKSNSMELLKEISAEMGRRPGVSVQGTLQFRKSHWSVPPAPQDMARLIAETDIVLTAIGD